MAEKKEEILVEVFPAKNGDSFLLQYEGFNMLIDCGYPETYKNHIKQRLLALKSKGEALDLLIITHIDDDHIAGAIKLLEENEGCQKNSIISINQIWHNSYRHLTGEINNLKLNEESINILSSLSAQNNTESESEEKQISVLKGSSLAGLILKGKYNWNTSFNGGKISSEIEEIKIHGNIKIQMLSPDAEKLARLQKYWRRELARLGFLEKMNNDPLFDDAFEFLLLQEKKPLIFEKEKEISSSKQSIDALKKQKFTEDHSPTNGSSLAFIVEINHKKILFLGDSHPLLVTKNIQKLYKGKKLPIEFDLIKISHHGSFSNNSPDLLKIIDSQNFIISSDGRNGHPDLQTLAWIIGRKNSYKRRIYFNYENDGYRFINEQKLMDTFNYEIGLKALDEEQIIKI